MTETVKIGNSWYVLEDICGIVGPQPNILNPDEPLPAKLLMRGGHILSMTDLGEDVVEYIRTRRDPQPDSPTPPVQAAGSQPPPDMQARIDEYNRQTGPSPYAKVGHEPVAKVIDVDMAPAEDIPT